MTSLLMIMVAQSDREREMEPTLSRECVLYCIYSVRGTYSLYTESSVCVLSTSMMVVLCSLDVLTYVFIQVSTGGSRDIWTGF